MTARQPRRRRRTVVAAPLPRPSAADGAFEDADSAEDAAPVATSTSRRTGPRRPQMREHHVTTDYGYVHRDLISIGIIGTIAVAFIIAMSFIVP